jgi:hypothetical protein
LEGFNYTMEIIGTSTPTPPIGSKSAIEMTVREKKAFDIAEKLLAINGTLSWELTVRMAVRITDALIAELSRPPETESDK